MPRTAMPPDVAKAQTLLDSESEFWSEDARKAWVVFRGYARKTDRISQSALPAVGEAAQEMVLARDHAHRAIQAMSGVFGQDGPDTVKHDRLPDDHDDER